MPLISVIKPLSVLTHVAVHTSLLIELEYSLQRKIFFISSNFTYINSWFRISGPPQPSSRPWDVGVKGIQATRRYHPHCTYCLLKKYTDMVWGVVLVELLSKGRFQWGISGNQDKERILPRPIVIHAVLLSAVYHHLFLYCRSDVG